MYIFKLMYLFFKSKNNKTEIEHKTVRNAFNIAKLLKYFAYCFESDFYFFNRWCITLRFPYCPKYFLCQDVFNPLKHKNIFKKLKKNVKQVKKKNGLNNSVILVKFKSRTYFEIFYCTSVCL